MLKAHNVLRCMHGVKPLRLDPTLTENARKTANAQRTRPGHGDKNGEGENISSKWQSGKAPSAGEHALSWWTEHEGYTHPLYTSGYGHFPQLVWKDTTTLGCARKVSMDGRLGLQRYDVACRYNTGNELLPGTNRWRDPTQNCSRESQENCQNKFGYTFPKTLRLTKC